MQRLPSWSSAATRRWSPQPTPRAWAAWQQRLQRVDRALLDALPAVGRTGWETVVVLQR